MLRDDECCGRQLMGALLPYQPWQRTKLATKFTSCATQDATASLRTRALDRCADNRSVTTFAC